MSNYGKLSVAIATIALAGCQTWGPAWSELSGARYTTIDPDRREAILIRAGDESIGNVPPFKFAPGTYDVQVQSPVHNRFRGTIKTIRLTLEPCRRYYINAQFADSVRPEWTPVVDYVEAIAGCRAGGG
jgi:hypothetical protein